MIFDMDGVLTDSEPLINAAAVAMFRELGLLVQPDDFLPFIGTGEDRYLGGVAEKYGFLLDGPAAKKRTYEIYLDLVPTQLRPWLARFTRHGAPNLARQRNVQLELQLFDLLSELLLQCFDHGNAGLRNTKKVDARFGSGAAWFDLTARTVREQMRRA